MSKYIQADFSKIKTISILTRKSKVTPKDFGAPFDPSTQSFAEFARSLPNNIGNQIFEMICRQNVRQGTGKLSKRLR